MFGWLKPKDYTLGAVVLNRQFLLYELPKLFPDAKVYVRDRRYSGLDKELMKDLVFKYWDPPFDYHSNSDDFPDCDDFALGAQWSVIFGAVKKGFSYPPAFGMISYYPVRGGYHRANWAISKDGEFMIYEPQVKTWKNPDEEIESVVQIEL